MQDKIRIIIAGSRHFDDYNLLETTLDAYLEKLLPYHDITIICGDAKGADALGELYAQRHFFKDMI